VSDWDASTYGERAATVYDEWGSPTADSIAFLAELAGPGPVLELGLATGNVSLPLAERGLDVVGVEPSLAMIEQLRAKPGGDRVRAIEGSLLDVELDERFSLVFAIGDTLFLLESQGDQLHAFERAAAWMADDGAFVVETIMPWILFERRPFVVVDSIEPDEVRISVGQFDAAEQRMSFAHVALGSRGVRLYPFRGRFALLGELDLMAHMAGLKLRERWAGWRQEPLAAQSRRQVSVYERA